MTTPVSQSSTPPVAAEPGQLSHRKILTIFSGLMLGMFLAALDQTIVSTSIRTIADDLHGLNEQAWTTTAYLITSTITTPLYGKLSDLYGRKPFFLTAISVFIAGSVMCTFATSMIELAAFRAFQGLGAGGLMSLALAIIADIVSPRERARYQGYILSVFGISSVAGPLVGGFLAGRSSILGIVGWRWVFLVNVPIGLVALVVVAKVLDIPHRRREHRIDWWGAVTITLGVVPLLLVAEQGQSWGWGSARALACFVVGTAGCVAWVFVERAMGDDALVPIRLFHNTVFSRTSLLSAMVGMVMFGGMLMIPQYLQIVKGASPTKSGLLMLPLMLGLMTGSIATGQTTSRTGRYKIFPVIGTGVITVALLLFYWKLQWDTALPETMALMALFGAGLGFTMQPLMLSMQNTVPPRDMGTATAGATFFRQLGGTAGTAIFLSVLFSTVSDKIAAAFDRARTHADFQAALAAHPNAVSPDSARTVVSDSSVIKHLDPVLAAPFKQGFADSMHLVFLIAAMLGALCFALMLTIREVPLRRLSGIEAAAAEAAESGTEAGGTGTEAAEPGEEAAGSGEESLGSGKEAAGSGRPGK